MRPLLPLAVAALLPPALLWPFPLVFGRALVASPQAEAASHLWGWWAALREGEPFVIRTDLLAWPDGAVVPLADPLHLLPYALGALWGPAAGYDLVLWFGLFVGGLGGWLLAREAGADLGGQVLGTAAGVAAPTGLGVAVDGITEGLGYGWVGVQLALLLSLRRDPAWWRVGALAAAIAAGTYAGVYNAVWMAFIDVPAGLWLLRRTRRHLLSGALALAASLPMLIPAASVGDGQPGAASRAVPDLPPPVADWRGAWKDGADLLDLVVPAPLTGGAAEVPTTAYLGVVLVGLALAGVLRDRRSLPWLLAAAAFAVLALGPWLVVGGDAVRWNGRPLVLPAGLLELWTPLDRLSRWYRAAAVAVLLLVPGAVAAVRGRWALLCAALVAADGRWGGPLPATTPVAPFPESPALESLDGPIAELPPDHPLFLAGTQADENLLLQVRHGQPTNASFFNVPGRSTVHPALGALRRVLSGESPTEAARGAAGDLRALGFRYLAVYVRRVDVPEVAALEAAIGPVVARDARVVVFGIPGR